MLFRSYRFQFFVLWRSLFPLVEYFGSGRSGLVVYDLAVLNLTKLPILVHDSVVLKQISDDAIEKIIELYSTCGKQVIIALDKQDSYSEKTSALLSNAAVLKLAKGGQELFGRSWG